ncbi:MAG: phage tail protein [Bacteroidia bacterium]
MSEPFLAEIRIMGFNFAPRGWAQCDGQILPINQNQSLYSLLGTTYGGDGRTSFALPDLRGRVPIHRSSSHSLGSKSGTEVHSLTEAEMASHNHEVRAKSTNGNSPLTAGNTLASYNNGYADASSLVEMPPGTTSSAGGGQAHDNMQPYTTLNFCIAIIGLFPSRN